MICAPDLDLNFTDCPEDPTTVCFFGVCVPKVLSVNDAEIRENRIELDIIPALVPGTLKVELIRDDGEYVIYNERTLGGKKQLEFKFSDMPKGNYARIHATWTTLLGMVEDSLPYRFEMIGTVGHTRYGLVDESECAGISGFSIFLTTPPPDRRPNDPCGRVAGTLKRTFVNIAQINGSGSSTDYGLVQRESFPACGTNPRPVTKWRRVTASDLKGAGRTVLQPGTSVAVGDNRGLGHSDSILIIKPGGRVVKTVDDRCPDCSDPANDDGQDNHIDNYQSYIPNCSAGVDDGNFKTIRLID